jgi:hypothetical protein
MSYNDNEGHLVDDFIVRVDRSYDRRIYSTVRHHVPVRVPVRTSKYGSVLTYERSIDKNSLSAFREKTERNITATATRRQQDDTNRSKFTMASRSLVPILRRSVAISRASSKALRGGSPPMPAYARIPAPSEPVSATCCGCGEYSPLACTQFLTIPGFNSWLAAGGKSRLSVRRCLCTRIGVRF